MRRDSLFAIISVPLLLASSLALRHASAADNAPQSAPAAPSLTARYRESAERIISSIRSGNAGYAKLTHLCDHVGHRLSGSEGLQRGVEWARAALAADGHENVRTDAVQVVRWVRGRESLMMTTPRTATLAMLGLGGSVGTPPEGITAEVISVPNHEALNELGEKVRGKIVLFDDPMSRLNEDRGAGYGSAARYRGYGARWASEFGALAALVRSATTRSFRTPHTGAMNYFDATTRIPSACISTEDAAMITRLTTAGTPVTVTLKMEARTDDRPAESANVIAELVGSERPDEFVVMGGHLDSWDVGQGALDDGGGCVSAMEALNVLRKLGLRARRTIRVVLFTNEENGLAGGRDYAKRYEADAGRHAAAIENDSGASAVRGLAFQVRTTGAETLAAEQMREISQLLAPIAGTASETGGGGADIGPLANFGVPMLSPRVDMTHYFDYHHTEADTIDKIDAKELDQNIAAMAILAYVLADMPGRLGEPNWVGGPTVRIEREQPADAAPPATASAPSLQSSTSVVPASRPSR